MRSVKTISRPLSMCAVPPIVSDNLLDKKIVSAREDYVENTFDFPILKLSSAEKYLHR